MINEPAGLWIIVLVRGRQQKSRTKLDIHIYLPSSRAFGFQLADSEFILIAAPNATHALSTDFTWSNLLGFLRCNLGDSCSINNPKAQSNVYKSDWWFSKKKIYQQINSKKSMCIYPSSDLGVHLYYFTFFIVVHKPNNLAAWCCWC